MILPLSEKIWWGDRHAILEGSNQIKSVLNVAQNLRDNYWIRISAIPQTIPYFRLSKHDDDIVDEIHIKNIDSILDMIERNNWYPTLVHCLAGCHRSMTTAVYAQWRLQGRQGVDGLLARVDQLLLNPGHGEYYKTFMAYIRDEEQKNEKATNA